MKKSIRGVAITLVMLFIAPLAMAQNTNPLTASCTGTASQNVITWSSQVSGGNPPYSYIWSGTNVAGATSSSVVATYNATGTYGATVAVTDTATTTSSSTTASSTCSATVSSLPVATSTPPTATTTPPFGRRQPFFRPPILNVNPSGHFLARGMVVESVASSSFVGKVWGTTWTVNTGGDVDLLFREGKKHVGLFEVGQLQAGDEVGVSGFVDPNQPLIVQAQVVRNYSLIVPRQFFRVEDDDDDDEEERRGRRGRGIEDIRSEIEKILEKIKELKKKIGD